MNKKNIKQIIDLNSHFYSQIASAFSKTRQQPWHGWQTALDILAKRKFKPEKVLDLASGNGRFAKLILAKYPESSYLGLDNNSALLTEAMQALSTSSRARFIKQDLLDEKGLIITPIIDTKFDLIALFGYIHHIPTEKLRLAFLKGIVSLLNREGIFIVSFWNFLSLHNIKNKMIAWDNILPFPSEQGDYLLTWQGNKDSVRYCHHFNKKEIEELVQNSGIKILKTFQEDGQNRISNYYVIGEKL